MQNRKLKVIQCYTGPIGCEQIQMVARHPGLELVGTLVHHKEKVGEDAGEIAGIEALGVTATDDLDALIALDADVVLYNPPYTNPSDVIPLLASGKNVITVAGGNNTVDTPYHDAIVEACRKGNATFHGTGLNPGLAPDVLPLVASSLCETVDHVHIYAGGEVSHISPYQLEILGFGKSLEEIKNDSTFADLVSDTYIVTTKLLARGLSMELDDVKVVVDAQTPIRPIEGEFPIPADKAAGVRVSFIGMSDAKPCITIEITWFFGRENVDETWLGPARDMGWTIKVTGDTDIELNLDIDKKKTAGHKLTASRAINDIPLVMAASPEPLTFLNMPIPRAWNQKNH